MERALRSRREMLRLFASATGVVLLASACGGGQSAAQPTAAVNVVQPAATAAPQQPAATQSSAAPTTAPQPAANPTQAPVAAKGTTIKLLETPSATVQAINDDYFKKSGVKIESEVIPNGVDQTAKLVASFNAGGSDYDVVRVDVIDLALYASSNWIVDVTSRVSKEMQDDLLPFAKQAVSWKGKYYGMPKDSEWKNWTYNQKLLKDAGFDKAPDTWKDYVDVAKTLQSKGIVKYAQYWGWKQAENLSCDYPLLVASLGGKYIDEASDELLINKDQGVQALQYMSDWLNVDKIANPGSITGTSTDIRNAQLAGDIVFGLYWGTPTVVLNNPDKSKVVGQCKVGLVPHTAPDSWTLSGPECWALSKGSKKNDDGWAYLLYRQGPEGSKRQFIGEGSVFGWRSLFDDPDVKKAAQTFQVDFTVQRQQAEHIVNRPMIPWYSEYSSVLQLEVQNALTMKKKPQQALDDVVVAYQKIKAKATGK